LDFNINRTEIVDEDDDNYKSDPFIKTEKIN